MRKLYITPNIILSDDYIRVVHGERGDYVEFDKLDITWPLEYKFGEPSNNPEHYYDWLYPRGFPNIKIYHQRRTVKYADYKIGKYYISPGLLYNFKADDCLFSSNEMYQ